MTSQHNKPIIVLIDDDDTIRTVVRAYLDGKYMVEDFSNAVTALEYLKLNNVDMVISDINMPEINGLELRERLNEFDHLEVVPFIFLTGSYDEKLKQKAKSLGIDHFISKPVKKDALLNVIEPTLHRREQVENALGKILDQQITESLRPSLPDKACGFNLRLESQEASAGGGDLVLHIPHKDFDYIIVADVMGHGVEAKFFAHAYAGYIYGLMRSFTDQLSVEGFLSRLNKAIYEDSLLEKSMLTVAATQIFHDGRVIVGTAGHPAPLVSSDSGVYEVDCNGMMLGAMDDTVYRSTLLDLSQGGRLLVFSDGLIELPTMLNNPDKVYKDIAKCMVDTKDNSIDDQIDAIKKYYKKNSRDGLRDDVTYVVIEFDQLDRTRVNKFDGFNKLM